MPNQPFQKLSSNTANYEQRPMVKAEGFREYDARWIFGSELNLEGARIVGLGLGTLLHRHNVQPGVVVGHDFRSYSSAIKYALITGLMSAGCRVFDIGMCTTPMAYFAQFACDAPAVAMVTASHNENGWTGIKMGMQRPLTFGQDEMAELKSIVLNVEGLYGSGGSYERVDTVYESYLAELSSTHKLTRKLRVGAVCGNGTAGAFAPQVLRAAGCEVVEINCELDHTFPNYNPNPEDLKMLAVMSAAVREHKLDVAFGFDGDGDRCGVTDNEGNTIYSDKVGLMLARDLAAVTKNATFVVDVKSTGLFATDPVLAALGAKVDYYKTGHSYIKRRTKELGAVAGFEKSGHFFFQPPFGRGYDDGLVSALAICQMLDRAPQKTLAELYLELPKSWSSPTVSPHCADELKYAVIERLSDQIIELHKVQTPINSAPIVTVNTINGIRFTFGNGSWGLIRASSNKPELVVVCESMQSETEMRSIFAFIRELLGLEKSVGKFNQEF
jgi:phosphomannomutase / phosphoglucomutase